MRWCSLPLCWFLLPLRWFSALAALALVLTASASVLAALGASLAALAPPRASPCVWAAHPALSLALLPCLYRGAGLVGGGQTWIGGGAAVRAAFRGGSML